MIRCTSCNWPQPVSFYNTDRLLACPSCSTELQLEVFPAAFIKQRSGSAGDALVIDDQASCFYHPFKQAVIPCKVCGRFLCSLCDVEFDKIHMCPPCFETGKTKRKYKALENHRVLYDEIALALALFPMLIFWLTLFTAPTTLFVAIRYWRAPSSIVPRWRKFRLVSAIFIAGLQIAGWSFLFHRMLTA